MLKYCLISKGINMAKRKAEAATSDSKKQKKIYSFFAETSGNKKIVSSETGTSVSDTGPDKKSFSKQARSQLSDLLTEQCWKVELQPEFNKEYFKKIQQFLSNEYLKGKEIFPPKNQIFNAFNLTPLNQVKVVILGQDPYHDNGQAHGLCFSVQRGITPPPSLKNIYKELKTDVPGFQIPSHGSLESWAKQGVLLLNATLTVEAHQANSHNKIGWQTFTDAAIKIVSRDCDGVVFILWGGFAHKKEKLIDGKKHTIIKAAHPSPLSATKFFGCKCFSKTNGVLKKGGKQPVDWNIQ